MLWYFVSFGENIFEKFDSSHKSMHLFIIIYTYWSIIILCISWNSLFRSSYLLYPWWSILPVSSQTANTLASRKCGQPTNISLPMRFLAKVCRSELGSDRSIVMIMLSFRLGCSKTRTRVDFNLDWNGMVDKCAFVNFNFLISWNENLSAAQAGR